MTEPHTFDHAVMHLTKYAGEAATIAERLDHIDDAAEQKRAAIEAREFLEKRPHHLRIVANALVRHLAKLYPQYASAARCDWLEPRPARGWVWLCGATRNYWTIVSASTVQDRPAFCPGCGNTVPPLETEVAQ